MFKKIAVITVLAAVSASFWLSAAVRPVAERRLGEFFTGARVQVAGFSFSFPPAASLNGIEIESDDYTISVAKAQVDLKRRLTLFSPRAQLKRVPAEWFGGRGEKKAALRSVQARDLALELDLKSPAFKAKVTGTVVYDFQSGLSSGHLAADSVQWKAVSAEQVVLEASGPQGTVSAARLKAGKLKASDLRGTVQAGRGEITVAPLEATAAGGRVEGEFRANFENGLNYGALFRVESLDMAQLTRDLEMERKMTASGTLDGKITLEGDRTGLRALTGRLASGVGGGDLVIRDAALIERLAQNVKQPVEIVEAAFKEYHFDKGALTLGLEEGDVALEANLEGAKGKRDLVIRLHDQP